MMKMTSNLPIISVVLIIQSVICQSTYTKTVVRRVNGDLFTPKPGHGCETYVNKNTARDGLPPLCQCPANKTTLMFNINDECVAFPVQFDNYNDVLYFNNPFNNPIFTIHWNSTNSSWPTDDFTIYTSSGIPFTRCTSYYNIETYEYNWVYQPVTQNIFKRKPGVQGLVLRIDPNVVHKRKKLQGRLITYSFACSDRINQFFHISVKFGGTKNYTFVQPTTLSSSPITTTTTIATTDTTDTAMDMTTDDDYTSGSPTSFKVIRSINGDAYKSKETDALIECSRNPPMTFMPLSNGKIGCTSVYEIDNWYSSSSTANQMLYIGDLYDIYTLRYVVKQNKWHQHSGRNLTFRNGGVLTSDYCYDDHVQIKSIFMFSYKGWEKWVGNSEDYFVLVRAPETGAYKIKFEYEHDYDSFAGQLLDIRMECQSSQLYHLFVKFEGSRDYNQNFDVNTIKPTKFPSKPTQTPLPQNDKQKSGADHTTLIISSVIAIVVLMILLAVVCFFVVRPKWRRRRSRKSSKNNVRKQDSSTNPWSKSAQVSLNVPKDPKQKEAEEILELAKEIISERKAQTNTPDIIPTYIKNRPAPKCQNPRPAVGPLSESGNYYVLDNTAVSDSNGYAVLENTNKYADMSGVNLDIQTGGQGEDEEAYLDLDEVKDSVYQELDNGMIKPDDTC